MRMNLEEFQKCSEIVRLKSIKWASMDRIARTRWHKLPWQGKPHRSPHIRRRFSCACAVRIVRFPLLLHQQHTNNQCIEWDIITANCSNKWMEKGWIQHVSCENESHEKRSDAHRSDATIKVEHHRSINPSKYCFMQVVCWDGADWYCPETLNHVLRCTIAIVPEDISSFDLTLDLSAHQPTSSSPSQFPAPFHSGMEIRNVSPTSTSCYRDHLVISSSARWVWITSFHSSSTPLLSFQLSLSNWFCSSKTWVLQSHLFWCVLQEPTPDSPLLSYPHPHPRLPFDILSIGTSFLTIGIHFDLGQSLNWRLVDHEFPPFHLSKFRT